MGPLALLAILYLTREFLFAVYCGIFFAVLWEWCDIARFREIWVKCVYAGLSISMAVLLSAPAKIADLLSAIEPLAFLLSTIENLRIDQWVVGLALAFWSFGIVAVLLFKSLRRVVANRALLLPAGSIIAVGSILAFSEFDARALTLIAVVAVAVAVDSAAYLIGNFFGSRNLPTEVSPSKTWEGTIAGFLVGLFCLFLFDHVLGWIPFRTFWLWPVVALFAIFGDLFESALKRTANLKDSGNLLPGHGGFLDRFDSLMALSVCTYFSVVLPSGS